ncbi:S8 family serine peptidase, partial [Myxococcota bacterium]|nr:S8 family serine peptidase [Myxococcota bacterium]
GIWHVKSVIEEDGLLLASRLWREHANLIRDAAPDLYLRRQLHSVPNDPEQPGQWYFDKIDMPAAWERSWGSSETTVAVIDNGCDLEHPDLKAKFDQGKDVVSGDDDPSYSLSDSAPEHGTACSGIIAADSNNGLGITGACPECRMRCVRMLGSDTEDSPISADILAFHFAYDTDVDVVSNSWGFIDAVHVPSSLEDVINMVFDDGRGGMGALVIFASGNDNRDIGSYELLAVRGVLGIGAVNIYDQKTSFTNFGDSVDLVAPTGTFTTDISGSGGSDSGDYTNLFGGTSSACPVAAGVAALLVSEAQDKTAQELYDILIETARPAFYADPDENGHDPVYGYGIINPRAALHAVMPPLPKKDDGGCSATGSALFWWMSLGVLGLRRRR